MTVSANFPHQLALLLVALQTDKLPICEHLSDPTEKSLVGSLMTYLNNRDFRTPITIARKTLGTQIRVKRSTLFNKLRSLKEKGLIEDVTGELPIRFTDKAIALMQLEWTKQADRWKEKKTEKKKTFRVGNSVFPEALIKLINRGVSEAQLRGLLCEAKKAGKKIQDILLHFETSLSKYDGETLFLVIRDILRKPKKYLKTDKPSGAASGSRHELANHELDVLRVAVDNDIYILGKGERLHRADCADGGIVFTSSSFGYQDARVDSKIISLLTQRMRDAVITYAQQDPDWGIGGRNGMPRMRIDPAASRGKDNPVVQVAGSNRRLSGAWHTFFAAIPVEARVVTYEPTRDSRVGRQLLRRGISYVVDSIAAGVASLMVCSGAQAGRICSLPVDDLNDPEIAWLKN